MTKFFGTWKAIRDNDGWRKWIPGFKSKESKAMPDMPESEEELRAMDVKKRLEASAPEAKVEAPVSVTDLQNSIVALKQERDYFKAEHDYLKDALEKKTELYDRLKRSMGLMPAENIANVPATGEARSPVTQFNEMPEGPEKTLFFRANKELIEKFINQPIPKA